MGILFTYPLQLVPVVQSLEGWVAGGPPVPAHVIAHEIGQAGIEIDQEIEREQEEAEDEENVRPVPNRTLRWEGDDVGGSILMAAQTLSLFVLAAGGRRKPR